MPLEDYSNYIYDFMETENCFKATVEDGTYDMEGAAGGLVAATMTLVGEAREEGLRTAICACEESEAGEFDAAVCDLLRIRAAQRIAVIKDRIEGGRCEAP